MSVKQKELFKIIMFIVVPFLSIFIYGYTAQWVYLNYQNQGIMGIVLTRSLWVISILAMCYLSQIKMKMYKRVYNIACVCLTLLFGITFFSLFINGVNNVFGFIIDLFLSGEDMTYLWFGVYLYCLIRFIITQAKSR